jgi:AcrR family transcriptional regulator
MKSNAATKPKRAYKQGARAVAAEETVTRIMQAMQRRLTDDWYDQITLDQVAHEADTTVQTIIRRFGSKEGLLDATWRRMGEDIQLRRGAIPGDVLGCVRKVIADYEVSGDVVMRALAQEDRYAVFKEMCDFGRAHHRREVEITFSPWLEKLPAAERKRRTDGLIAALDLYIWRLIRRDMGRSAAHVQAVMLETVSGIIGERF